MVVCFCLSDPDGHKCRQDLVRSIRWPFKSHGFQKVLRSGKAQAKQKCPHQIVCSHVTQALRRLDWDHHLQFEASLEGELKVNLGYKIRSCLKNKILIKKEIESESVVQWRSICLTCVKP